MDAKSDVGKYMDDIWHEECKQPADAALEVIIVHPLRYSENSLLGIIANLKIDKTSK